MNEKDSRFSLYASVVFNVSTRLKPLGKYIRTSHFFFSVYSLNKQRSNVFFFSNVGRVA